MRSKLEGKHKHPPSAEVNAWNL